jgi:hypothetical protein
MNEEHPRTTSILFRNKDEWVAYIHFLEELKRRPIPESFTNWVHRHIAKERRGADKNKEGV